MILSQLPRRLVPQGSVGCSWKVSPAEMEGFPEIAHSAGRGQRSEPRRVGSHRLVLKCHTVLAHVDPPVSVTRYFSLI